VSLANLYFFSFDASELEDISASEELDSSTAEEFANSALDSDSCSEESCSDDEDVSDISALELPPETSAEGSDSGTSESTACVLESLPQLAQKSPATDRQLKRNNLRTFMFPPFFH
jgi:hypothetical protein